MRLGTGWNRRSFLGTLGMIAGSMMASKKLFAAKGEAPKSADSANREIPTKNWESRPSSIVKGR